MFFSKEEFLEQCAEKLKEEDLTEKQIKRLVDLLALFCVQIFEENEKLKKEIEKLQNECSWQDIYKGIEFPESELESLRCQLNRLKNSKMSEEELESQRRSIVYGNTKIGNEFITKKMVNKAREKNQ